MSPVHITDGGARQPRCFRQTSAPCPHSRGGGGRSVISRKGWFVPSPTSPERHLHCACIASLVCPSSVHCLLPLLRLLFPPSVPLLLFSPRSPSLPLCLLLSPLPRGLWSIPIYVGRYALLQEGLPRRRSPRLRRVPCPRACDFDRCRLGASVPFAVGVARGPHSPGCSPTPPYSIYLHCCRPRRFRQWAVPFCHCYHVPSPRAELLQRGLAISAL